MAEAVAGAVAASNILAGAVRTAVTKHPAAMLALTHSPSPRMDQCLLTFLDRQPIDCDLAQQQHRAYCQMLRRAGVRVRTLQTHLRSPDAAFIEDTAVILDEITILASPGNAARRRELVAVERELADLHLIRRIEPPAMLEGGDVLRIRRELLVGLSSRTNSKGIEALTQIVKPCGYRVIPIPVDHCLHLKTACTALNDHTLLINPDWIDTANLSRFNLLSVPAGEPWAANVIRLNHHICLPAAHRQTATLLRQSSFQIQTLDLSEFAKAEGGISCLSLLA
ncbi:MAG TPA: dimethylargininase [Planctomycetaceae bacterium]|nr:dimethylargininase [Planctomycetaceae bacterium]